MADQKCDEILFPIAYRMGVRHLKGESALTFTRRDLDRLKLGQELTVLPWGINASNCRRLA
jgi:hypothetical protein